jgi:hypothetical protein
MNPTEQAVVAILQLFFGSNPTVEEILAFIEGVAPALASLKTGASGSIPAFRAGSFEIGPIPFAPYVAPAAPVA